ncbi:MAG: ArsI/CadI family heavy metal resistance metalloenzyme [Betaproteobacteria bacterium]
MKRFHVHLGVPDLPESIRFYSKLFGMPPAVEKPDYAKWMLDDPRVNFAISKRGAKTGLNHLGLQVESDDELAGVREQFEQADASSVSDEANIQCCYARGNKHWVRDPQGIPWEAFHTLDSIPLFGGVEEPAAAAACGTGASACCTPAAEQRPVTATGAKCCA